MNLHLTAAEWQRIAAAGAGVLFRAGDMHWLDDKSYQLVPPAEFVEAAQRCEHDGHEYLTNMNFGRGQVTACNLCKSIDGKRRVAVVVPCPGPPYHGFHGPGKDACSGLVTVGHVVVTWGPLVVAHIRRYAGGPAVVIHYDGSAWLATDGRLDRLTLPPDVDPQTLVGQYAIGVEVVS